MRQNEEREPPHLISSFHSPPPPSFFSSTPWFSKGARGIKNSDIFDNINKLPIESNGNKYVTAGEYAFVFVEARGIIF